MITPIHHLRMQVKPKVMWIFGILTVSLYIAETALTIDFSGPVLPVILQLDLFLFLIGWHLGLGLIAPLIRKEVWEEDDHFDDPTNEGSEGFFPMWFRFLIPVLVAIEVLWLQVLLNSEIVWINLIIVALYILIPSILLLKRKWYILFITVLFTWFPIEWGVIDDALGNLSLTLIPFDALLGIFSLLWGLVIHGRHIPWYDWDLTKKDLALVGKISGILTLAIVPLGIATRFITINPDNFLHPDMQIVSNPVLNSFLYIILVFYLIFMVQGLMEETLFRDIIFKHQYYWLQDRWDNYRWAWIDLGHVCIILAAILVASIPFWDDILIAISSVLPLLDPITTTVGNMALPLGDYEGRPINAIAGVPLWPFYLLVALLLLVISLVMYSYNHDPVMAALLISSMIFGFAHFQDFRYVFFASVAGFGYGYCYYKTKNLVPAAMVHMGVDAVWVLLLNF